MAEVLRPRALTYSGTFHQWACSGLSARRTLPTICVHMCRVSAVADQSSQRSSGQSSLGLLGSSGLVSMAISRRCSGCRIVVEVGPEPAFDLVDAHLLAGCVVGDLVAANLAEREVARLRMSKV